MHFLDVFLLYCLFNDSPPLSAAEQAVTEQNLKKVVTDGRRNNLELLQHNQPRLMQDWAEELFADMMPIATHLDTANGSTGYSGAVKQFYLSLLDPALTFSGQLLNQLLAAQQDNGRFTLQLSAQYRQPASLVARQRAKIHTLLIPFAAGYGCRPANLLPALLARRGAHPIP